MALLPSSSRKRRTRYKSARAVRPPTHVVTEWTRIKVITLAVGTLLLAVFMITPLLFISLPNASSPAASKPDHQRHVGLGSLMTKSREIRQNWGKFVEKEEQLLGSFVEKEEQMLINIEHKLEEDLLPLWHSDLSKNQEERIPLETLAPGHVQTYLGRGVAGLPLEKTPALEGAEHGHIECDVDVDYLAYWNNPQGLRDKQFVSPYAHHDEQLFFTFEPDEGGWNNIRMSMETIFVLAAATGRTLVLPPSSPFYLLGHGVNGARSFGSFFPLHDNRDFDRHVSVISMHEFITKHGKEVLGLSPAQISELEPLSKTCLHSMLDNSTNCELLNSRLRNIGWQPEYVTAKDCLIFDEEVYNMDSSEKDAEEYLKEGGALSEEDIANIARFCGTNIRENQRTPMFYNKTWNDHKLLHWNAATTKYRMLNHFYSTMLFTSPKVDNFYKRFVRDFLHYKDEIYCAAGKIVNAVRKDAGEGDFVTWHVRRGDFQYKTTRLPIEEWYENTKETLEQGQLIYIATDEKNRTFFEPLTQAYGHPIRFLDQYSHVANLKAMDPSYLGMIDTIVASYGRRFVGTWFSTYSGYINRLRGYQGKSMRDSWYSFMERKTRLHEPAYPFGNYPAREWSVAWTAIDGDEWILEETEPRVDNTAAKIEGEISTAEDNDGEVDAGESETVPIDRKVPTLTIDQLDEDQGFLDKPVARGVAGLPMSSTPAMEGAARGQIECDINVDSLAYWNDPQGKRDQEFQSPFRVEGEKFITFGIDQGGWNNVRMALEIIFVVALATGRTLVLPPEIKMYLLNHDTEKKTRGFADFFPLHTKEFQKRVKIMKMSDFMEREGGASLPEGKNASVIKKAADHCDNRAKSERSCMVFYEYLQTIGYNPGFRAIDGCVVFDENVFHGRPMDPKDKLSTQEFCGERTPTYWTKEMSDPTIVHFHANVKQYRLLTHFYSMIHFTNDVVDNFSKRFVRDFMHYHDSIFCAAGKIVKALQHEGRQRGLAPDDEGGAGYSAMHIRRGDLQYKKVKLPAKEWWDNTKELWEDNEILYIATDERNRSWFNPIARKRDIRFLDDYWDFADLSNLDPNYMGMVDTIVASRGRVFVGTWFSTFSGYINRMRGYHGMTMKDSWYSFLSRKTALHNWTIVDHYAYAYEWPTGWIGIDGDVEPSKANF